MMTVLEEYRPIFMVVTFGLLGSAFYLTYHPRATPTGARSNLMAFNKIILWAVMLIAVVMLFFPQAVPGLFASSSRFTCLVKVVVSLKTMP